MYYIGFFVDLLYKELCQSVYGMDSLKKIETMAELHEKSSWVEVYRAFDGTKVALVESLLSSENIPLQLNGELVNRIFGGALAPINGVSILVPSSYEDQALRVLKAAGYLPEGDVSADAVVLRGEGKKPLMMNRLIWVIVTIIVMVLAVMAMFTY